MLDKGCIQKRALQKLELMDEEVANCFDKWKEHFAAYLFLQAEQPWYRKQLNNAAEQMNSAIEDLCCQPILNLIVGVSRWTICKNQEHSELAKKWIEEGSLLKKFATSHYNLCMDAAILLPSLDGKGMVTVSHSILSKVTFT
jgi:hypothetical protein